MRICVYGASSAEIDREYIDKAFALGKMLASSGHTLIFGGGANGVMGAVARGATQSNGEIVGVAPTFFNADGVLYDKCTTFHPTQTMRERKQLMEDNADAFIMAPGGIGTFEEFFEILTLKQLGRHEKPIAVYNVKGYFDRLVSFLEHSIDEKFMIPQCRELFKIFDRPEPLIEYLEQYKSPSAKYKNI